MKKYAYIHIISLAVLVCISSCRSNSSLSETRKEAVLENTKEQLQSAEQSNNKTSSNVDQATVENSTSNQQTTSDSTKDSESDEYKTKETEVDIFDKDGKLRATIRTKEQSGRTDKTKEQTGSSHSSNESRKDSTNTKTSQESETYINKTVNSEKESDIQRNTDEEVNKISFLDNRLIQGIEWIYVGAAAGLILIVCVIIYFIRKREK